jgi:hypothetical protein
MRANFLGAERVALLPAQDAQDVELGLGEAVGLENARHLGPEPARHTE